MRIWKTCVVLVFMLFVWIPGRIAHAATSVPPSNPGAETGNLSGWTYSGATPWTVESGDAHGGTQAFVAGNDTSYLLQRIDLLTAGFTQEQLDTYSAVQVSAWVKEFADGQAALDTYDILLAVEGEGHGTMAFTYLGAQDLPSSWTQISAGLGNYGAGMRYVRIELWSADGTGDPGMHGAMFDDISFSITGESTAPTLLSSSPADGTTGTTVHPEFTFNFSEDVFVNEGDIIIRQTSNDQSIATIDVTSELVTGSGTETITMSLPTNLNKGTEYYVTINNGAFQDRWDNSYAGISLSTTLNFRTKPSNSTPAPQQTRDYTITNAHAAVNDLGEAHISWLAGASVPFVRIFASVDGAAFERISDFLAPTAPWTWQVPHEYQNASITFFIESTDLATQLGSATTESITWISNVPEPEIIETTTVPPAGSYVRTAENNAVYFIRQDGKRLPIPNAETFFTWESTFDSVQIVSSAALMRIPVGPPLLPKPGTMLIKIQSVAKVYVLDGTAEHPVLRWLVNEQVAADIYGAQWASNILELPPTHWPYFSIGSPIATPDDLEATENR